MSIKLPKITFHERGDYDFEYRVTLPDWERAQSQLREISQWAKDNELREHVQTFIRSIGGYDNDPSFVVATHNYELAVDFMLRFG